MRNQQKSDSIFIYKNCKRKIHRNENNFRNYSSSINVNSNQTNESSLVSGSEAFYLFYLKEVVPNLKHIFNYKNQEEIPRITKIVINQTYGDKSNTKGLNTALNELAIITGQKGIITKAKKSIAGFNITEGDPLGIKVTLRRRRMYAFLHRLIHLSLPRIRDFRGLKSISFDGLGNYSFGIEEQLMFPEMNPESIQSSKGLHISIVTNAKTDKEAYILLKQLGMPFQKNQLWDS
jgi:large subunit ribosomal protein L5